MDNIERIHRIILHVNNAVENTDGSMVVAALQTFKDFGLLTIQGELVLKEFMANIGEE